MAAPRPIRLRSRSRPPTHPFFQPGSMRTCISCAIVLVISLTQCGCLTPWNTRFPTCMARSDAVSRREAEIEDPFPERDMGPDVGFRPRGFDDPRAEQRRSKERAEISILRQQNGVPGGSSPGLGGAYPESVNW